MCQTAISQIAISQVLSHSDRFAILMGESKGGVVGGGLVLLFDLPILD